MVSMNKISITPDASIRLDIQTAQEIVSRYGTPIAYDTAYQILRNSLSSTCVAKSLSVENYAMLVVDLDDIAKSIARTKSVPYGYGRLLEFSKYIVTKIEGEDG